MGIASTSAVIGAVQEPPEILAMDFRNILRENELRESRLMFQVRNVKSLVETNAFIHEQNKRLFQQRAIAEEEYRESEFHLSDSQLMFREVGAELEEIRVAKKISQLRLKSLQAPPETGQLQKLETERWKLRYEIARIRAERADGDAGFRRYQYDVARYLAGHSVESKTRLTHAKHRYDEAQNNAGLSRELAAQTEKFWKESQHSLNF